MALNQGLNTKSYCSDIIIRCERQGSCYNGRELLTKLAETFKIVSDKAMFYHTNFQRVIVEIKQARRKKRAIRTIHIPPEVSEDKFMVMSLVSNRSRFLERFHSFRNDFDVVLAAASKCGSCLKYLPASHPFLNHPEIGYKAVSSYGDSYMYLSDNLKNDRKIVLRAAMSKFSERIPHQFSNDREIALILLKYRPYEITINLHEDFLDDSQIILQLCDYTCKIINRISYRLRNDPNFIMDYTKIHKKEGFKYFPSKFHDNVQFVKRLVDSHLPLSAVPEKWRSNWDIVKTVSFVIQVNFLWCQ